MRTCPSCDRTYADDSLIYCLDDGASLSPPFHPPERGAAPSSRSQSAQPTEVLPAPPPPTVASPAATVPSLPPDPIPAKHARKWPKRIALTVGVFLSLCLLFLLIKVVVFTIGSRNTNLANTNVRNNEQLVNLDGYWEGVARKYDPQPWTIQLTLRGDSGIIRYPSRRCAAQLTLISKTTVKATYQERMTEGADHCSDGAVLDITKMSDDELLIEYLIGGAKAGALNAGLVYRK